MDEEMEEYEMVRAKRACGFFPTHYFNVSGVTFGNRQAVIERSMNRIDDEALILYSPNISVDLVPEENPHDPHAVAVFLDGTHIGYVPRLRCKRCNKTYPTSIKTCPTCDTRNQDCYNVEIHKLIHTYQRTCTVAWCGCTVVGHSLGVAVFCRLGNPKYYPAWDRAWNILTESRETAEYNPSTRACDAILDTLRDEHRPGMRISLPAWVTECLQENPNNEPKTRQSCEGRQSTINQPRQTE